MAQIAPPKDPEAPAKVGAGEPALPTGVPEGSKLAEDWYMGPKGFCIIFLFAITIVGLIVFGILSGSDGFMKKIQNKRTIYLAPDGKKYTLLGKEIKQSDGGGGGGGCGGGCGGG
mmetsp:Transcript_26881/g.61997  ORF Transcript_26881/g.61997 Transcript_26881/m.61997 type:complete len:115 (+) Transcript_26881:60-404(+)